MKPHWILIANSARARLFQQEQPAGGPALLKSFEHPASRLHSSELGDDEAGRERSDRGPRATVLQPRLDPHRKEHLHFARELAAALEHGASHGECASISVFAASPFLGELKQEFGTETQRLLESTHDVDLTHVATAQLDRRLREQV
jgi:protein required for attachment to host cells